MKKPRPDISNHPFFEPLEIVVETMRRGGLDPDALAKVDGVPDAVAAWVAGDIPVEEFLAECRLLSKASSQGAARR